MHQRTLSRTFFLEDMAVCDSGTKMLEGEVPWKLDGVVGHKARGSREVDAMASQLDMLSCLQLRLQERASRW